MRFAKQVVVFLKNKLNHHITKDEQFNKILRVFFIFGFFRQKSLKFRLSPIISCLIFVNIFLGCWKNLIESLRNKKLVNSLLAIAITLRAISVISECALFVFHQSLIISMIDELYNLNDQDNAISKTFTKLCSKLIRTYRSLFLIISVGLITVNLFLNSEFQSIVPVFIHCFGNHYLNFFLSFAQFFIFLYIVISLDLLPIISVLKLEALVAVLCNQLKLLTTSSLTENEKKLKKCIELHIKIIAWVGRSVMIRIIRFYPFHNQTPVSTSQKL